MITLIQGDCLIKLKEIEDDILKNDIKGNIISLKIKKE